GLAGALFLALLGLAGALGLAGLALALLFELAREGVAVDLAALVGDLAHELALGLGGALGRRHLGRRGLLEVVGLGHGLAALLEQARGQLRRLALFLLLALLDHARRGHLGDARHLRRQVGAVVHQ